MSVETIIRQAHDLGITLRVAGDRIEYAPRASAPGDFVEALRRQKAEVIAFITQQGATAGVSPEAALLSWASELAEQDSVLSEPVQFVEAPLRTISTGRVSWYAAQYLRTITFARQERQLGGWGRWTPTWWKQREQEALGALAALRDALSDHGRGEVQTHG